MSDDPDDTDSTDTAADGDDPPTVDNPFATPEDTTSEDATDADGSDAEDVDAEDADSLAPFSDLARGVDERRRRREETPDDDFFEHVEVGDVDEDDLWRTLDETDDQPLGSGEAAEEVARAADAQDARPEHVVDKREYCQQCPFFSAPPAVACGHEGTDIVEVVDAGRFRVRGCPMVTDTGRPNFGAVVADAETDDATEATDTGESTPADAADATEADT
ncbi:hypothetical protein [Halobaculum limi]|uniref:hypothetical protein n=1 Tax=Halobaculum limi TaxID=3031916 RepID=UPI0024071AD1|nr:hypothetical protein [Halobaculum sp. YSMS11]